MRKFAVIGLGQYGYQVAVTLAELGADVLAIDKDPDVCESMKRHAGVHPLCLDATDELALGATGVEEMDAVVVAIGQHIETSIIITALLRRIPVRRTVARSSSDLHEDILTQIGADLVYNPEKEMGIRAAQAIFAPDVHDRLELSTGHHMAEIEAREPLFGKTLGELDLRGRYELTVIAVRKRVGQLEKDGRAGYEVRTNMLPEPGDTIERGDVLVVLGVAARVREFVELWR